MDEYLAELEEAEVDAVIVADPGIFMRVKKASKLPIHMSTQGSLTNSETVRFWRDLGAERVVLARELTLDEIRTIERDVEGVEIETFVHGAMCMSYSGRCLMSNYMTGRDANQGDCAQPCRYKYHLVEENRPGEYFPIESTAEGSFILNSKDLCMIEHIDELIEAGIRSLKIEGRVKSAYYLATVIRAYRMAIDAYYADPKNFSYDPRWLEEIKKYPTEILPRAFTTPRPRGRKGSATPPPTSKTTISSASYWTTILIRNGPPSNSEIDFLRRRSGGLRPGERLFHMDHRRHDR